MPHCEFWLTISDIIKIYFAYRKYTYILRLCDAQANGAKLFNRIQ